MTLDFILGKDVLEFDVMETNGIKKGVLNDLVLYFTGSFINAVKDVNLYMKYCTIAWFQSWLSSYQMIISGARYLMQFSLTTFCIWQSQSVHKIQ